VAWVTVAALTLFAAVPLAASPQFGATGNIYDLDNDSYRLEATFVGRTGVRYAQSRAPTGTINVDDRSPFQFGPFVGCFLREQDEGRVVASGDSCDIALEFTNTSGRDLSEVQLDFSTINPGVGPVAEWTSERSFDRVGAGESVVVRMSLRFDQPVGPSTNQVTTSGSFVENGEPFTESAELAYEVNPAPPTVPRSVSVTKAQSFFGLSWQPPISDGGSKVTGYLTRLRMEHPDRLAGISGATRWSYDEIACVSSADTRTCEVPNQLLHPIPPGPNYRFAVTVLTELSPDGGYEFYTEPFEITNPDRSVKSYADAPTLGALVEAIDFVPSLDAPILRFYVGYFDRVPDLAGAKYWLGVRRQGFSLDEIAAFMSDSDEFRDEYQDISNAAYIDRIYRNLLGREYDRAGYEYWLRLLEDQTLSRSEVIRWITDGEEFIADHPYIPAALGG
jgi:hypothetical protein